MRLKTVDATVRLTTWNASIGTKAPLQKAWVRISNIPVDKRVEEIFFYAGSLVGVSLDMDASTLHKPEYMSEYWWVVEMWISFLILLRVTSMISSMR
jgi:hypothetical protein